MKVLMVLPADRGGVCQYTQALCENLSRHGIDLILLASQKNTELDYFNSRFRVFKELNPAPQNWWQEHSYFKKDFQTLKNWVSSFHPDIVHFQEFPHPRNWSPVLSWLASQSIYTIHTAHNLLPHHFQKWHRDTYRLLYQQCQGVITHTQDSATELNGIFEVAKDRIAHINHGNFFNVVNLNPKLSPTEARNSLGLTPDDFYLLFFGPLENYRGLDTLLRALAYLKKYPQIKLLIAGERGRWNLLENTIDILKIRSSVILYPEYIPVRYVGQYFQSANAVVLPYHSAYSGSSIFMAYSFGLPVITSNLAGPAETVVEGKNGFLAQAGDAGSLAQAIQRIYHMENYELLSFGNHNLSLAQNLYHWPTIAGHTLTAYRRWLSLGL